MISLSPQTVALLMLCTLLGTGSGLLVGKVQAGGIFGQKMRLKHWLTPGFWGAFSAVGLSVLVIDGLAPYPTIQAWASLVVAALFCPAAHYLMEIVVHFMNHFSPTPAPLRSASIWVEALIQD